MGKAAPLQATVLQSQSQPGSKPFTDSHIQCRTDTVSELSGMVVVTKHGFGTATDRKEPVIPEGVSDHLIFVLYLDNFVSRNRSLLR